VLLYVILLWLKAINSKELYTVLAIVINCFSIL
jgi:hypothetical protein